MHDDYGMVTAPSQGAFVSLMQGDWEAAQAALARCSEGIPPYLYVTLDRLYLACQISSVESAEPFIARLEENLGLIWFDPREPAVLAFAPVFADYIKGTDRRIDHARERAEAVLVAAMRVPWTDCWANASLGLGAVIRGDAALAERAYEQLQGIGPCAAELPLLIDHLLGLFARTMGRPEMAVGHFEAALSFARAAGYRPPYGWAAADYAAMLLERNADGDHARAISLQNEALAIGRELGMRPLVERVLARREMLTA
jgi:tetratricopeptide (TPR) repeat protein